MNFTWSYSSLKDFTNCPKQYQEVKVLKNFTKKATPQMLYGTEVHKACEDYVGEGKPLAKNYERFKPVLDVFVEMEGTKYPEHQMGLDIGPKTAEAFAAAIRGCQTVFWNGPMGVFEFPNFANGTKVVAQALTEVKGLSVVGGGDSAAAVRSLGFADSDFGYISTGGGASLEYLEGKELPGISALQ